MDLFLQNKTALVTGATAGIGRAVALSLAAEGARLAVVGRRRDLLESIASDARAAGAPQVSIVELDMMQPNSPAHATQVALEALGSIAILMNCMGASRSIDLAATDDIWEASMTLNWTRHRQLTHLLLPEMRRQRWGRIVNVTGPNEVTGLNSAAVAKAAVHAWAKGVSDLVAPEGITVNCIGPGKIDSEQMQRLYSEERRASFSENQIPAGRFGTPQELADLATFLASPRASYITGTVMHVDGGLRRYMF